MPTEREIKDKWKRLHDILGRVYYQPRGKYLDQPTPTPEEISEVENALGRLITGGLDKETFDSVHGALWAACEAELVAAGYGEQSPPAPAPEPEPD